MIYFRRERYPHFPVLSETMCKSWDLPLRQIIVKTCLHRNKTFTLRTSAHFGRVDKHHGFFSPKGESQMLSKKKIPVIELVGWYGALAYILAYALASFHIVSVDNLIYQLMNLSGAGSIFSVCYVKKTYQPMVINLMSLIPTNRERGWQGGKKLG